MDMEESDRGLIWDTFRHFPGEAEENEEKL